MKTDIYTQYEGIQTQDIQTMLDAMNRSMREHSDGNPKGRWEMMNGQFIGVVEYTGVTNALIAHSSKWTVTNAKSVSLAYRNGRPALIRHAVNGSTSSLKRGTSR